MTLTAEEVAELKEQLREQIKNLPEEQHAQAEAQIQAMSAEAIELMLRQQQERSSNASDGENKTIFRMIVDKEVTSYIIDENADAIAVLDINPLSKGHTLIIPKKATANASDIPAGAFALAKELGKKIVARLKAQSTDIQSEKKFGEAIIHVIPIYDSPVSLTSPRKKGIPEELEKIAATLKQEELPKMQTIQKTPPQPSQTYRLRRKIP